jgi:cation transport regulator ChaB
VHDGERRRREGEKIAEAAAVAVAAVRSQKGRCMEIVLYLI